MTTEPEFRWTQDDWGGDSAPRGSSPLRQFFERHGWLVRGAIVLLALLLFELTTNAAVATAASCLELGRTDFATALWVRRTDPDRRRGRFNALCYLAWAFCRVGLMAIGVIFVLVIVTMILDNGPGPKQPPPHAAGAFVMMLVAFSCGAGLSFFVCLSALVTGRKIWLGPEPRRARRQGVWPPSVVASTIPGTNLAKILFHLAWAFLFVPINIFATFISLLDPKRADPMLLLGVLFANLVAIVVVVTALERRILARAPWECWPIDESGSTGTAVRL